MVSASRIFSFSSRTGAGSPASSTSWLKKGISPSFSYGSTVTPSGASSLAARTRPRWREARRRLPARPSIRKSFIALLSLVCPRPFPFPIDGLSDCGDDLVGEDLDLAHVLPGRPVDKSIYPELQGKPRQLLDPLRYGPLQEAVAFGADAARQVQGAPDLFWLPSGRSCTGIDPSLQLGQPLRRRVGEGGNPPVGEPADQIEHPWSVGAHPDAYLVDRVWSRAH